MSFFSRLADFKKRLETPFETLNNIFISKEAILSNFDIIRNLHPDTAIFPVLKSNAYGHGIKEIATILKDRKTPYLVVDSYFEALKIREVNNSDILLIGYTLPANLKNIDFSFITLTVYDFETLEELSALKKKVRIHLKIDTGMHRQGIYTEELPRYLDFIHQNKNLMLEGICMHYADSDNQDNTYSDLQSTRFKEAIRFIKGMGFDLKYIHSDNSSATLKSFLKDYSTALRLGISLYGINPLETDDDYHYEGRDLKPALSFYSTLILKKGLKKGEKVSYNGTFTANDDMTIGIVPVGYYEGLSRKLSNNYSYGSGDDELKILGRICMNLTVVDITGKEISVGDSIEIISTDKAKFNSIYEAAKRSETITYECFTRLSETIRRSII